MTSERPTAALRCWDCGAENDPAASECWLCHRRNWQASSADTKPRFAEAVDRETLPSTEKRIAGIALILVLIGILIIAPGLAIAAVVIVGPPWLAGAVTKRRARRPGKSMSALGKVVWVLGLSIVFFVLMYVALGIALWLICLATGPPSFH
jgi:hypothetical protein